MLKISGGILTFSPINLAHNYVKFNMYDIQLSNKLKSRENNS